MQHLVTEKPNACNTINKNINLIFLLLAVVQHNLSRTKIKSSYIEKVKKKTKDEDIKIKEVCVVFSVYFVARNVIKAKFIHLNSFQVIVLILQSNKFN